MKGNARKVSGDGRNAAVEEESMLSGDEARAK